MSFQDELNRVTKTPEDVLSEREKEIICKWSQFCTNIV